MEPETRTAPADAGSIGLPQVEDADPWRIRILTADILRRFDGRLPEGWLYDILVTSGHLTYFQYADAIGTLVETGSVAELPGEGETVFSLTASGLADVRRLRGYVPKVFRDRVHRTALRYQARQQALRDLQISTEPALNGCRLCLRCMDRGEEMFFLRLQTLTAENAELLSECILRNPARFFGRMLDLALTNAADDPQDNARSDLSAQGTLSELRTLLREHARHGLQVTTEPDDKGCRLCLRCMHSGEEMFFLRIQASTGENAALLSERILRDPARFFGRLPDLALTNEEDTYDLSDN